jgi:hypothetical protein
MTCATCKPFVNSNSKFESREGNSKKIKQNEKRKRIGYSCAGPNPLSPISYQLRLPQIPARQPLNRFTHAFLCSPTRGALWSAARSGRLLSPNDFPPSARGSRVTGSHRASRRACAPASLPRRAPRVLACGPRVAVAPGSYAADVWTSTVSGSSSMNIRCLMPGFSRRLNHLTAAEFLSACAQRKYSDRLCLASFPGFTTKDVECRAKGEKSRVYHQRRAILRRGMSVREGRGHRLWLRMCLLPRAPPAASTYAGRSPPRIRHHRRRRGHPRRFNSR